MMRRRRRTFAFAALLLVASCGDNGSSPNASSAAGSGGEAAANTAGSSSSAGSFSNAGASSSAGSSSSSGAASGGASGAAGSASGAAGTAAGTTAGSGGALSAGGSGGATASGPPQTVSGQLYGLTPGESITLQNNAGDDLTLSANGKFSFAKSVAGGAPYNVTIRTAPASPIAQTCLVWDGTGTVGDAAVTDVRVNCDLLAYYPFNGNAKDASGYGHDGTVSGATLTTDRNSAAQSAYAFTNKATIQAAMPVGFLPLNDQPRTLTAWLRPSQTNSLYGVIFWGAGNCTGLQFGLSDQGDKAGFWGGCDDFTTTQALALNAWTFVALVYSPDQPTALTLYVNGASSTTTITPLSTGASASFMIGGDPGSATFFTGDIDSVRIYGHALSAAELTAIRGASDP